MLVGNMTHKLKIKETKVVSKAVLRPPVTFAKLLSYLIQVLHSSSFRTAKTGDGVTDAQNRSDKTQYGYGPNEDLDQNVTRIDHGRINLRLGFQHIGGCRMISSNAKMLQAPQNPSQQKALPRIKTQAVDVSSEVLQVLLFDIPPISSGKSLNCMMLSCPFLAFAVA